MLCPISDVLLFQLISSSILLLPTINADYRCILVRLVVWVSHLRLIIKAEEKFDIPSEYSALGATGKEKLFLAPLDVTEALLR